jgi:HPr kinase/phosphorylase
MSEPTIHATCLLVGVSGVLIRGPSGSGKSRLALALIDHAEARGRFAAMIADDRVLLSTHHGRLVARAPGGLTGLVERRGLGIEIADHEAAAVVSLVVDIVPDREMERLPAEESRRIELNGVGIGRLSVPGDIVAARSLILAALGTRTLA